VRREHVRLDALRTVAARRGAGAVAPEDATAVQLVVPVIEIDVRLQEDRQRRRIDMQAVIRFCNWFENQWSSTRPTSTPRRLTTATPWLPGTSIVTFGNTNVFCVAVLHAVVARDREVRRR
jgi:hypothetical protein